MLISNTKKLKSCLHGQITETRGWKKSTEAATGGVLWTKVFLTVSQNSQENTCARVSFLIKLQPSGLQFY